MVDMSKNSNIKCEHCRHYISHHCFNESSPKYNTDVRYWNRCKAFAWKFSFDDAENAKFVYESDLQKMGIEVESRYVPPVNLIMGQIETIQKEIVTQQETTIMAEINRQIGVEVDKRELVKALNYDRDQYKKGYRDGAIAELKKVMAEIIDYQQIECNMDCDNCKYIACVEGKDIVENIKLIDKHIAKLEGEQE